MLKKCDRELGKLGEMGESTVSDKKQWTSG